MSSHLPSVLFRIFIGFACLAGSALAPMADAAGQNNAPLRVSKQDYAPQQLLVKYRAKAPPRLAEEAMRNAGAKDVKAFKRPRKLAASPMDYWRLLTFGPGVDLEQMRVQLLRNPHVEQVEYDYTISINLTPNDPLYPQLWGLNNIGQTGIPDADIDAPEAWNLQTGSQDVVVAVIDSGVAYNHPDLAANIWTNPGEIPGNGMDDDGNGYIDDVYGYDFHNMDADPYDDHGHGTHVSGTIAGVGNNGIGVVGVSWNARIMGVKFLDSNGNGTLSGAVGAVLYAADMGAKVMNNSWGGGYYTQVLQDAIVTADQSGALFVAAAGNETNNNDLYPTYPTNHDVPNVLSVAATDQNDALAYFSNYGATTVHLGAPGVAILSTVPTEGSVCCSDPSGYKLLSGTSMATPHVSGAAVVVFAYYPGITHRQVKDRLMYMSDPIPSLQGYTLTGGRLNMLRALEDDNTLPAAVSDLALVKVGGSVVTLGWSATGDDGLTGKASSYDLRYSTAPINESNFAAATTAGLVPVTGPAGTPETYTLRGLLPRTQYYFALKAGDNVGNISTLSNVIEVKTKAVAVVFKDDFEYGPGNWSATIANPPVWHISDHRYASASHAMYYGKEDTLTYDSGGSNRGSLTSVPINLAGVKESTLSFNYFMATENLPPYDTGRVQISVDNGSSWTDLFVTALNSGGMVKKYINLAAYDGKSIRLRFSFDTGGTLNNAYEGWVVDDVTVSGEDLDNDTVAPAAVTDLAVQTAAGRSVTLTWTAPGDDGMLGTASGYDLRYATVPIDPANPDAGTPVGGMPAPKLPGSAESFEVTGLTPDTTYYFVLRAFDNVSNVAASSNIVSARTTPLVVTFSDDFEAGGGNWTVAGSDGGSGPALWHISSHRFASRIHAMYYGKDLFLNYNTGKRNFGSITSPTISLFGLQSATLRFNHFLATENLAPRDAARVQISADNQQTWTDLYVTSLGTAGNMLKMQFNLDAFLGKFVLLRFNFDTVDATENFREGWVLDDVAIEGPPLPPVPPVANTGGPYTGGVGTPVQFNGTGSFDANGDAITFAWSFGDGTPVGTGIAPTHVYAAKGSYTVTLVVNDGQFDSAPATTTVSIVNLMPVAKAGGPYTTSRNKPVTFDGSLSSDPDGEALTYAWTFGDGSTGTGPAPVHAYATTGVYTVTLTVSDGIATATATATATITNQAPVANAGGPYSVLRGKSLSFNGALSSDPDGDPLTYAWTFGDGTTGTGVNPVHVYPNTGSYTVTLTVSDGALTTTASTTVTVTNTVPVANAGGPYTSSRNKLVTFDGSLSSDPEGDPLTYAWTFGDGSTGTGPAPVHAYATTGVYTVTLTVSDGIATATATTTATVTNQAPVANAGGPYTVLRGKSLSFNGALSSDPDGDPLTYAWKFGDGTTGTSVNPTHVYPSAGSFTATLTVSDGVLTATASSTVTVTNTAPVANAGGPYTIPKYKPLSFDGSKSTDPDGDPLTYAWNFGDGSTGTGVSPAHTYAKGGLYPVTLTVSDNQLTTSVATTVTVTNQVPVASFTAPALVYKNDAVALNGSASSDADGDTLTYRWDFGSSPQPPSPSPTVTTSYTTVGTRVLSLTVNDGEVDSAPATRSITVQSRPPVANAGPDQTVLQRTTVVLSAANSTDPDGVIANVAWRQVSGTAVTLTSAGAQSVSFVAPPANNTGTLTLVFEVTVTDNDGVTATDQVTVTVMKRL